MTSNQPANQWPQGPPNPWARLRPLSDIREATEPSLLDIAPHEPFWKTITANMPRNNSLKRTNSQKSQKSQPSNGGPTSLLPRNQSQHSLQVKRLETEKVEATVSPDSQTDQSSAYSLSLENVPRRSPSSKANPGGLRERSLPQLHPLAKENIHPRSTIPHRGPADSPLRNSMIPPRHQAHEVPFGVTKTVVRSDELEANILLNPTIKHPRLSMQLHLSATIFVGGGSIEGCLSILVDDLDRIRHKRQLTISQIRIELFGIEEISDSKRSVFLNLLTNLVDAEHPPPRNMVESTKPISHNDQSWHLTPSRTNLPFLMSLPLDVGPPPFQSRHARIKYLLAGTVVVRDQGKPFLIRVSEPIAVISVLDRMLCQDS
jgi:hypothetical protein